MNTLKNRRRKIRMSFILVPALALVVLAISQIPVSDHYHSARGAWEQLNQARKEKESYLAVKDKSELLRAEWARLSCEEKRLKTLFPLENELPFVLVDLEKTIKKYPLNLQHMRTGGKMEHHSYGALVIALTVSGNPSGIDYFLKRLMDLPYFITLDNITWTYKTSDEAVLDLELELYYIDPDRIEPLIDRPDVDILHDQTH